MSLRANLIWVTKVIIATTSGLIAEGPSLV